MPTMSRTILITGATGNVAATILPHLTGKSVTVRALVRDPAKGEKLGVETVQGDLEYHHTLPAAFAGADTVVIIHPPGPRAPAQSSNALWAAKQAGVKRVVRLSAIGAGYDAPTINGRLHGLSDHEVAASGLAYTIIKPHFFLQNLLGSAPQIAKDGKLFYGMGDGKLPMIDVRDIGEFFARVLLTDGHDGKTYTITGPSAVTFHELAAALSRATGKPVTYIPVPTQAAAQGMKASGMDDWMVGMMVDYMNAYARSWASEVTPDFQHIVGRPARSVDDFARDFATIFRG
jgi:uncharacterized protein YbjT (DUF2867 family)